MSRNKIIKYIIYILVNLLLAFAFTFIFEQKIRIAELTIILFLGFIISFTICCCLKDTRLFFQALKERIVRPFAVILSLVIRIVGVFIGISLRLVRLLLGLTIGIVYGVWPIDLVPDIIVGFGWIDDAIVFVVALYYGLAMGRIAIANNFKDYSRNINTITKIKTKFPKYE